MENQNQNGSDLLKSQGNAYTEKGKLLEDARSSAYIFNFIGVLGIFALLLIWAGIIPLEMAFYMQCIFTIVMGALFLFFIGVGIKSIRQIKKLREETSREEAKTGEMVRWIMEHYPLEQLDARSDLDSLSMEQLYFARTEKISEILGSQFGPLEEKYLDFVIEKIYQAYVPKD